MDEKLRFSAKCGSVCTQSGAPLMYVIDLSKTTDQSPFWQLTRWFTHPENVVDAEREEASAAGVTDFDDFGIGLAYNRQSDAETVAKAMAKRFNQPFGVYGGVGEPTIVSVSAPGA
jgi:hypothetical protein